MSNVMTSEEVRQIRKLLGLTSEQLSEKLGVSGNTVRRWECGMRQARGPAVALLRQLAARKSKTALAS